MLRGFYGIICVIAVWLVTSSGGNTPPLTPTLSTHVGHVGERAATEPHGVKCG
jgi:hypothetical protein